MDRIIELIRSLAAAETDRERAALRSALGAELRAMPIESLTEALTRLRTEAQTLASADQTEANVALLELFAEQHQAVTAELAGRNGQHALGDRAQAALSTMEGEPGEGGDAGRHDPSREPVQPGGDAAPVPDPTTQGGDGNQPGGQGTTATEGAPGEGTQGGEGGGDGSQLAGRQRNLGALNNGGVNPERAGNGIQLRMMVDGNVPGFTAGQNLDREALARAFVAKAQSLNSPGAAGRHTVAHIEFDYPESNTLSATDFYVNQDRIAAATTPQALTAAQSGGLCLPLEVIYDIQTVGVTDRPVRDALTPFRVERGGIQYRLPFDALAMAEGLGVWGQDNDQSVNVDGSGTVTYTGGNDSQGNAFGPKSCLVVDCPGVVEASIYATYLCLEFANMTARFDTEWVDATNSASLVSWSRFAENQLLSRLMAASKITYSTVQFSAVRDILATYDKVISYYRNRHRLNTTIPLHTIMPQWLINMLLTDVARSMNTSGDLSGLFGVAQSAIESWFRTRNVNVTWHLDGLNATAAAVDGVMVPQQWYQPLASGQPVPGWPNAVDALLYKEGDWLFLDGGTLDIGLVRDSQLNLRNRYQTFTETYEGVAFRGLESLRVVMPLVPNGASSGTIAPPTTTDGMAAYTLSGG